jgi:hypothetical protein
MDEVVEWLSEWSADAPVREWIADAPSASEASPHSTSNDGQSTVSNRLTSLDCSNTPLHRPSIPLPIRHSNTPARHASPLLDPSTNTRSETDG